MSCTGIGASDIGSWSTGLWTELGQPTDISALTISGWASQSFTVGALNNRIGTCFSGISGAYVCPDLSQTEFAILEQMYRVSFYNRRASAMVGAGGITNTYTELREGDSVIRRGSVGEVMKTYVAMAKDAQSSLNTLTYQYLQNTVGSNTPKSVDMFDINNGWKSSP